MNQLPAYLQGKTQRSLNAVATAGMGSLLPPHISIRGNSFTLVDAQGAQQPVGATMQAVVVDISDQMNKMYYENDWTPGSDEPPTCFSKNGIAPSRDSVTPQSPTCAACQWNVRGSDVSKISGKAIKACRDQKDVAVLLPQYPQMLFQLVIPPGSFKNWSAFMAPFSKGSIDVSDVLIQFGFQPQVNGVMTFQAVGYIPEHLVPEFNKALANKATDVIVGRNDVPIALPAPAAGPVHLQAAVTPTGAYPGGVTGTAQFDPPAGGGQPAVPFGATGNVNTAASGFPQTTTTSATTAASHAEPARRRRRTQAEIAADNAAKMAAQSGQPAPGPAATAQPEAPFPVQQQDAPGQAAGFGQPGQGVAFQAGPMPAATGFGQSNPAPAAAPASFGIQNGAAPDPQLAAMLASLGGPT